MINIATGKKAQIFALLITIAVLIVSGYAVFKFITAKTGTAEMFASPAQILELKQEKEKFEFFATEAAKLAIVKAYQQLADKNEFAGTECMVESNYINFCSLALDIDEIFSSLIQENMNKFVSSYPNQDFNTIDYKVTAKGTVIKFDADKKQLKVSEEGTFSYSATYNFEPSFSISLENLDLNRFEEIYNKMTDCKKKEDVLACMQELRNFNVEIKKSNSKIFFDLKSKKRFFIDNIFKNIDIKFSS